MTPRRVLLAGLLSASLVAGASPALAMTPRTSGWNPSNPPEIPGLFALQLPQVLYSITCQGLTATAWAANATDESTSDWHTVLVTTSSVASACIDYPAGMSVRQGDKTFVARPLSSDPASGAGTAELAADLPSVPWEATPVPRVDQWVAVGGRAADGASLPMQIRKVTAVGKDTFTIDAPVGAEYVGGPVLDNMARAIGVITVAGSEVTGTPQLCSQLFDFSASVPPWLDITAPSAVTNAKAVGVKGGVLVTWQAAASGGGSEVAYWYRIGSGDWIKAEVFRVKVPARKGTRVTVTISTTNYAGSGPTTTVSAKAK